ncbi:Uncharacterised protein [Mycobacteroides abscessus subsp. abscessus]|nr:Uncharacterised protein [Mycobacteroides abscessus subsp. abscessus]
MPPGERPSREVLHAHAIRQVQVSLLHVIGQCHLVRLRRRGKLGIVGQPEFGARTRVIQGHHAHQSQGCPWPGRRRIGQLNLGNTDQVATSLIDVLLGAP